MDLGEFGVAEREADPDREPDVFSFCGERFQIADQQGSMPMLRFAAAATSGVQTDDLEALAVTHDMIRDCLADGEWPRFQRVATVNRARTEDLMPICRVIWQVLSGRPTIRPSDSSDGPSSIGENSPEPSSSEAPSESMARPPTSPQPTPTPPTPQPTPSPPTPVADMEQVREARRNDPRVLRLRPILDIGRELAQEQATA